MTHKKSTGLFKAARQEEIWKHQAFVEGVDEAQRANKVKHQYPEYSKELLWDSNIAYKWSRKRDKRASKLFKLAEQYKKEGK